MSNQIYSVEDRISMLKDLKARIRAQAIQELGELRAKSAVEPLIEVVNNYKEKEDLRHQAMEAIAKIDGEGCIHFFIKRLLYTSYRNTYWDIPSDGRLSITATKTLVSFGEKVVEPLLEALKSDDKDIRGGAAYVLRELKDKRAINPLITLLLNDKDVSVRCQAAESLEEIGEAEALGALEKVCQTDFEINYIHDSARTTTVSEVAMRAIEKIKSA